jgi:hemolysin III
MDSSHASLPAYRNWQRFYREELANAVTHGIGLVLSILGASVMVASVLHHRDDGWRTVGCIVYLASLVAVYTMSTLSHSFAEPRLRARFRALDQGFIYLLIAATYTPFALTYLRTGPWWLLFGAIWAVALFGFLSKVVFTYRVNAVSIWTYVVLGWMPVLSAPSIIHQMPMAAFWGMLLGGLCYSIGTVFLACDQKVRHFHAVWHLCVIAGSACHFVVILLFVASAG